jgi:2-iminobutanoate/2-iminopropanoate deaminase
MTEKRAISTPGAPKPGGAYSQGVAFGSLVFTAGVGPIDPTSGQVVGETIEEQTAQVLRNLEAILRAEGLSLADVLKCTVHLKYLERDFVRFDATYRSFFKPPYPVRTTVGSDLLHILVEIDCIAGRPDERP